MRKGAIRAAGDRGGVLLLLLTLAAVLPCTTGHGGTKTADPAEAAVAASAALEMLASSGRLNSAAAGAELSSLKNLLLKCGRLDREVLTPVVENTVPPLPGFYPLSMTCRIRVMADLSGWQMRVKAGQLQNEDDHSDRISARDIHMRDRDGDWLRLHQFQEVVKKGPAGTSEWEIRFALESDCQLSCARFSGELYLGVQHPSEPATPLIKIPFIINVDCSYTNQIDDPNLYFHFGDLPGVQEGSVQGRVTSTVPMMLSLRVEEGRINELSLVKPLLPSGAARSTPIPLNWSLSELNSFRTARCPGYSNGNMLSWPLSGTPGEVDYQIKLRLSPEPYQVPGDYGMEVELSLEPVL